MFFGLSGIRKRNGRQNDTAEDGTRWRKRPGILCCVDRNGIDRKQKGADEQVRDTDDGAAVLPWAGLTAKEQRFCEEYLQDHNATRAAIRAGYSEKTAASNAWKILRRPGVQRCIKRAQQEQRNRLCLSGDRVVLELFDLLEKCKEPEPVRVWSKTEKRYVNTGEYKFDSRGALKTVELLMKHLGMLGADGDGAGDAPVCLVDDLAGEHTPGGEEDERDDDGDDE